MWWQLRFSPRIMVRNLDLGLGVWCGVSNQDSELEHRRHVWCHWFKSREGVMGQDTEVRFERFGDWCLWPSSTVPGGCMGARAPVGPVRPLQGSFPSRRPRRAPPAAEDESLQQPRPDPAEQRVRCVWPAARGHRGQHRLLAVHGGGHGAAAEPDHGGQDGTARWPLARLLLRRYRPHLPSTQLSLPCGGGI